MFKKRNDLIPNLVNTVKGYMNYEEECLSNVIKLRNLIDTNPFSSNNNEMGNDLKKLLAIAENYPNLKANEHLTKLYIRIKKIFDISSLLENINTYQ